MNREKEKKKRKYGVFPMLVTASLVFAGCGTATTSQSEPAKNAAEQTPATKEIAFNPPKLEDAPKGELGEAIQLGYKMVTDTKATVPQNVGNNLSCISCHADGGTNKIASPLVGVTAVHPQYRDREGKVITMEDRINECFKRSMNGKPLEAGSKEMTAMIAYLTYISEGIPTGADIPWRGKSKVSLEGITPDKANGEKLYKQSCLACHGADGSGTGPASGPAVWGEHSFNDGAGLARISQMTGYIQKNMPKAEMGGVKPGELSKQQAADLAAYLLAQERPEFTGKKNDWPKGNKPKDVKY
ncbi:c-type cytochrome [Aneurinibacillus migulanus]|uniref:c-type cytochrome n=1 Tax=Aneurinibacillus migulanus TaxID=47500 RepID=UPI00209FD07B|nr:c-type cytochrome [Aneurinibacillus migulanus]MCP1356613.1 c-type cytochrome [Aneurinibacillus migulanus]